MTDEELIGKVLDVWVRDSGYLYRLVLREHENGFSKTMLKLDTATKKWITLKHKLFICQEVVNG